MSGDLGVAWQRVVDEVRNAKKATVATVLAQARPGAIVDGALTVIVTGNHFHRDLLNDKGHREVINQAVRRWVPGADRITLSEGDGGANDLRSHPAVQAAIAGLEGEVVAVRPRPPEGEGQ